MAVDGGRRERYHLAQVNVGVLREPLDAPATAGFVAALEPINQLADHSPGFVWRLQTPEGDFTAIRAFDDDRILMNMSVWESLETLRAFTYASRHLDLLRSRREWFHRMADAHLALWWVPAGHVPTIGEAVEHLELLRRRGPSPDAFTMREPFPAPEAPAALTATDHDAR
jgi:Domain of unknown function (DUF3291)